MNRKTNILFIVILIFAALMTGSYYLYSSLKDSGSSSDIGIESKSGSSSDKTLAENFTVLDNEGNEVSLSDFAGKPVVLNFWASWCPPCRGEMPDLNDVYAEYGEGISFMMVNMTDGVKETQADGQGYVDEQGYDFPVYFDTTGEAANVYDISGIPTTLFIDADGYIVASVEGAMSKSTMLSGIEMIVPASD